MPAACVTTARGPTANDRGAGEQRVLGLCLVSSLLVDDVLEFIDPGAVREKESHGLLPLYVALVSKAPAEVALAVLEALPQARGARSLRRFPPAAA